MLEIRTNCEHCGKLLPNESLEALVCSFECTFCKECVENLLHNVCPNCGGGFEKRPIRPKGFLQKYPVSNKKVFKPIDMNTFKFLLDKNKSITPDKR